MSTRIPRPAARGPLGPVDSNVPRQKQASKEDSQKKTDTEMRPLKDQEGWEEISAATGLTIQGLLETKMTGKSKNDLKGKLEQCMAYIKQLRACVRYLDTEAQMLEADRDSLENVMESTQARHEAEARAAADAAALVAAKLEAEEMALSEAQETIKAKEEEIAASKETIREAQREAERASDKIAGLEKELGKTLPQLEDAQKQIATINEQYNKAQEYIANLQEYNAQKQRESIALNQEKLGLQEEHKALTVEVAKLSGDNTVLQAQLTSAKASLQEVEKSRAESQEDCTRLREDLAQVTGEREGLASRLATATAKLDVYDQTSGKTAEELRETTAAKEALEAKAAVQAESLATLDAELSGIKARLQTNEGEAYRLAAAKDGLEAEVESLKKALVAASHQIHAHEAHRRKLHNSLQEMKGNIRVFCRLRPAEGNDTLTPAAKAILEDGSLASGTGVQLSMPGGTSPDGLPIPGPMHLFTFDRVFGEAATQEDVFDEIQQLVQSALDGHRVCIFAYGQTGSGKTHTMMGDQADLGMIPRAMEQIICSSKELEAQGWKISLRASMMEIYNEEYKDLLGKGLPAGKVHRVIHDAAGTTTVSDLTVFDVSNPGSFESLMERALAHRSVGSTAMNERSSRSHCVFTLNINGSCSSTGESIRGVLNLIDLAGSERLSKSQAVGERLKETQAINKSLSALGDVICAIGAKAEHVPFRNSKLTWYLQPCLGGDAKTLMFVNIAPSNPSAQESLCSLRFAAKVNSCEIGGGMKRSRSDTLKS